MVGFRSVHSILGALLTFSKSNLCCRRARFRGLCSLPIDSLDAGKGRSVGPIRGADRRGGVVDARQNRSFSWRIGTLARVRGFFCVGSVFLASFRQRAAVLSLEQVPEVVAL